MSKKHKGFEDRWFLTYEEWLTYTRRGPVRYVRHPKNSVCALCDLPATKENPLENAHLIPFTQGVLSLGLTPDYLDSKFNIITAHKRGCNKKAELTLEKALEYLSKQLRLFPERRAEIPSYLEVYGKSFMKKIIEED